MATKKITIFSISLDTALSELMRLLQATVTWKDFGQLDNVKEEMDMLNVNILGV